MIVTDKLKVLIFTSGSTASVRRYIPSFFIVYTGWSTPCEILSNSQFFKLLSANIIPEYKHTDLGRGGESPVPILLTERLEEEGFLAKSIWVPWEQVP